MFGLGGLGIAQPLRPGTQILQIYWIYKDAIDIYNLDGRSVRLWGM